MLIAEEGTYPIDTPIVVSNWHLHAVITPSTLWLTFTWTDSPSFNVIVLHTILNVLPTTGVPVFENKTSFFPMIAPSIFSLASKTAPLVIGLLLPSIALLSRLVPTSNLSCLLTILSSSFSTSLISPSVLVIYATSTRTVPVFTAVVEFHFSVVTT